MPTFYTTSRGIAAAPELPALLGGPVKKLRLIQLLEDDATVIGWGLKATTKEAKTFAHKYQCPYWQLEDGFISYLGHPVLGDRRFSLVVDKTGIYYDATRPSDIEQLLNHPDWQTPALLQRTRELLDKICRHRISKYNHEGVGGSEWEVGGKKRVLVVDQTFGDCSIAYGLANEHSFREMLEAALRENPDAEVWVKVHPDVVLGKKRGHFQLKAVSGQLKAVSGQLKAVSGQQDGEQQWTLAGYSDERIRVLADPVNAQSLFDGFDKVYVVTSQLGFEALWHGKTVVCFGVPFYSGWGLTDDRVPCHRRQIKHTIESLFAAACLLYSRYIDPETGQPCELEDIIELIALQRPYQQQEVNTLYLVGFSLWKRAFLKTFLGGIAQSFRFVSTPRKASRLAVSGDGILIWGAKHYDYQPAPGVKLYRCEDAFVRGVGLGADLKRPQSLVLDRRSLYFDCSQPSDLEHAISTKQLSSEQIQHGQNLRKQLVTQRISKYNLQARSVDIFHNAQQGQKKSGQKKILVTGQVDSDASIKHGSPEITSNHALLMQVRASNPEACIVYKPHPDVVLAGRAGHIPETEVLKWADHIAVDIDIFHCIAQCDEVHVLTSLAGFEALLQGKIVHAWGSPFYSGWGVTVDHTPCHRRQIKRSVDELVYFAYVDYSRYVNWNTRRFTTLERMLETLKTTKSVDQESTRLARWFSRKRRKLGYLTEAFLQ